MGTDQGFFLLRKQILRRWIGIANHPLPVDHQDAVRGLLD